MPCRPFYDGDRKVSGMVCGGGRGGKVKPCSVCGIRPGDKLCDGPGNKPGSSCDAPICIKCATSIPAYDVDYCPTCVKATELDLGRCAIGETSVAHAGPFVEKEGLCLRHALLFDFWIAERGGGAIYRREDLDREQKRIHFRTWLAGLQLPEVERIAAAGPREVRRG